MAASAVEKTYDIVPTSLAVKAMRDNGYRNAAYAVAELMDNSIQAGASVVELLCMDQDLLVDQRSRKRLSRLAVLDNGSGMDASILRIALQFGNGSRLEEGKKGGMGRFGMGLPSASISQCKRVDVWSWQAGPDSALHSYIDLDEIEREEMSTVPEPVPSPMPEDWRTAAASGSVGESGTLVVWSKIDRSLWRTSGALIRNSEELIGRMYRKWISEGAVRVRLAAFREGEPGDPVADQDSRPNDPMYLMAGTSTPKPFVDEPMFEPYPNADDCEVRTTIRFNDRDHEVVTRFSIAKPEARPDDNAGALPHGRHAARNMGVSIVRAGRELELDMGWINGYDPRERWWGCEIQFDPGLDELFGVANNKQSARNLAEAAKIDVKALAKDYGGSISAARQALEDDEDPIAPLLELASRVQSNIEQMRKVIRRQTEGRRRKRFDESSVEQRATEAVRRRQEQGFKGASDDDEEKPTEERQEALAEQLVEAGHSPEEASQLAAETIDKGLKYRIEPGSLEGGAFFSVQSRGGVILVTLNTDHPAYNLLLGAQDPDGLPDDPDALKERLLSAQSGLEMMLFAWARYEDEQSAPDLKRQAQNVRYDWGRMAENFLLARG